MSFHAYTGLYTVSSKVIEVKLALRGLNNHHKFYWTKDMTINGNDYHFGIPCNIILDLMISLHLPNVPNKRIFGKAEWLSFLSNISVPFRLQAEKAVGLKPSFTYRKVAYQRWSSRDLFILRNRIS